MLKKYLLILSILLIANNAFAATVTWQGDESATWATGGNWDTGSAPTAADDAVLTGSAACTIAANAVCRSLDASTYTGTLTHNASVALTIGDATAGAGNKALDLSGAGMTYTLGNDFNSQIIFLSSSSTTQTVNYNGFKAGAVTFGSASVSGKYQLTGTLGTSAVNPSQYIDFKNGTLDTNGQTVYCGYFYSSYTTTRVLTFGASVIHIYQVGTGNFGFVLNNTFCTSSMGSGTLIFEATSYSGAYSSALLNLLQGACFIGTVIFNGAGTVGIGTNNGSCTAYIGNLYRQGTAVKTEKIIADNLIVNQTLNLNGNSSSNRLMYMYGLGISRTLNLTGANISNCSNVDFQDMAFGGSPDFSAITGGSGDCGGNTGATFTTATDWYWHNDTGNYSNYTKWYTATDGGGTQMANTSSPLPQDRLYFDINSADSGSKTVTFNMPRMGSIDATGENNNMSYSGYQNNGEFYGSLIIPANSFTNYGSQFNGRSGSFTLACFGMSTAVDLNCVVLNGINSTYSLGADIYNYPSGSSGRGVFLNYGTFDANDYNINTARFGSTSTAIRTIRMGNGDWNLSGTDGWNVVPTNLNITAENSRICLNNTLPFYGGNQTYNNISIAGSAVITPIIYFNNTFNVFRVYAGRNIKFTAGTNTTVQSFVATGSAGNIINITSASAANHTLYQASGTNTVSYCNISRSWATGGATWNANDGTCTDELNNTGWVFASAPASSSPAQVILVN